MRKLIIATTTLLIGIAVIWLGYLWVTCPTEDLAEHRLWLWQETNGSRAAALSVRNEKLYAIGAHLIDPLYTYHSHGLFLLVRDEGAPLIVFAGNKWYYWLDD